MLMGFIPAFSARVYGMTSSAEHSVHHLQRTVHDKKESRCGREGAQWSHVRLAATDDKATRACTEDMSP